MNNIEVIERDFCSICVPEKDIVRYSGCRDCKDKKLLSLCAQCLAELSEAAGLKAVYTKVSVTFAEDMADFGFCKAQSKSLKKFLGGNADVYIFAATIGLSADRLISRYSTLSPSKAVIMDGCATAAIECFCDYLCSDIFCVPPQERFSPGYGDLPLNIQPEILKTLSAHLNIGLSMTDSMLLTPTKSVTAIVKSRKD